MNKVKPASLCSRCGETFADHSDSETCPDGRGAYCRRPSQRPANSFSEEEIAWLAKVMDALCKHADTRELRRAPELKSVVKKTLAMRNAITRRQEDRDKCR